MLTAIANPQLPEEVLFNQAVPIAHWYKKPPMNEAQFDALPLEKREEALLDFALLMRFRWSGFSTVWYQRHPNIRERVMAVLRAQQTARREAKEASS